MRKKLYLNLILLVFMSIQSVLTAQGITTVDTLTSSLTKVSASKDSCLTEKQERALNGLILRYEVLKEEVFKLGDERDTLSNDNMLLNVENAYLKQDVKKERKNGNKKFFGGTITGIVLTLVLILL